MTDDECPSLVYTTSYKELPASGSQNGWQVRQCCNLTFLVKLFKQVRKPEASRFRYERFCVLLL